MPKYDGEAKKKEEKKEKEYREPVGKRVGREIAGFLETFSPRTLRGITTLIVAIPTALIMFSTMSAVFPHISYAVNMMAPIIASLIPMFIVVTILSLLIGVVRRLV